MSHALASRRGRKLNRGAVGLDGVSPAGNGDAKRFILELESLARRFKLGRWQSGEEVWEWQMSLLDIQRAIQAAITTLKRGRRSSEQQDVLERLKEVRWQARRLGDAFAWVLLDLDMPTLHSLADNVRVPVSVDGHGSTGMIAVATHLANEGWGFPVIHDATDCLRVGDITFVDPQKGRRQFRTVEVKTKLIDERSGGSGKALYTYQVEVIYPAEPDLVTPDVEVISTENVRVGPAGPTRPPRMAPRTRRQMNRMTRALLRRRAVPGKITHIPGDASPLLSVPLDAGSPTHWKELRRVIRGARKSGYASLVVDGAMIYMAFYDEDGLTQNSLIKPRVAEDLLRSGLFDRVNEKFPNSVVVSSVPPETDRGGLRYFLPHFLYKIPQRAIADLLHRRLAIVILSNPARFVDALEALGLEVSNPSGVPNLEAGSIVVTHRFSDDTGREWVAELHNLHWHVLELLHEFKAIEHLQAVAIRMRDAAEDAFVAEQRDREPRTTGR